MFKLSYKELRDGNFNRAFGQLANYGGLSTKTAINIAKIKKALDAEVEIAQKVFIDLLKKFAELDEAGEIKPHNGVPNTYNVPEERQPEFVIAMKEFEQMEFEVDRTKVTYRELDGAKMSANDILALDPILTEEEMGPKGIVKKPEPAANA